jgi:hypothetical protein
MNISIFKDIFDTKNGHVISVGEALERIKKGKSKEAVLKIREENEKGKRNDLKKYLPCACFGGTFKTRNAKGLITASGFAILDFDNIELEYKEELKKDKYIYACWVSPTGTGLKALVRIPTVKDDTEYKKYYNSILINYQRSNVDKSTKDISRACYESWDEDIFVNTFSEVWVQKVITEKPTVQSVYNVECKASDLDTYNNLIKWIEKTEVYSDGNRNNYLNKLAYGCNNYGLNKSMVLSNFKSSYNLPEREIEAIVNSAYKDTSVFNTASFVVWEKITEVKRMIKDKIPIAKIKEIADDNTIEEAKKSLERKISSFWGVISGEDDIRFNLEKFINWLEGNGFFKHLLQDGKFILIKINDNIVKEVYQHDIRRHVFDYINSLPFEFDGIFRISLQEWFFKQEKKIISNNVFELLTSKQIEFFKDDKKKATLFFKNGVFEITGTGVKKFDYKSFDGYIWENQIIQRDFNYDENLTHFGDFEQFLKDVLNEDKHNFEAMATAIGYLIHSHKPSSFAPAIVLNDKMISDDPNGGTGKGIIAKAIGQFKNTVRLDGKSFDFNKTFVFQRVELSTNLLFFDDIKQNFNFENLFSIITEGLTVEKKNKGEFFIPFENAPKILMTTNYALKGEGNSIERRKIDFELEQYYNKNRTPYDKFGKMFFDDWNDKDWDAFYNMIVCFIQLYLLRGLIQPVNVNLAEKRLIANTGIDFIDYMRNFDDFNIRITKTDFHHNFTQETNMKQVKSNTLTKWVRKWCEFYGYNYEENKYNNIRNFTIYDTKTISE